MEEALTLLGDEVDTLAAALEDPVIQDNTDTLQRAAKTLQANRRKSTKPIVYGKNLRIGPRGYTKSATYIVSFSLKKASG